MAEVKAKEGVEVGAETGLEETKKKKGSLGPKLAYVNMLLKNNNAPKKVMVPKGDLVKTKDMKNVTPVPQLSEKNLKEIELQPIQEPYSFVRILYDSISSEYIYEALEPPLSDDEANVLRVMKTELIDQLKMADTNNKDEREKKLRNHMDRVLREIGIHLNPISKERVAYYLLRDFTGYGSIQVAMIDSQVEDISCDGVKVPLYIYHRKYGSIRSNLMFGSDRELDSFVVWTAQRCGKHISVADPMLDATMPDGSRLQETLGRHVTKKGSSFTIRRFRDNPFTPLDLIKFKTMSIEMMAYLWIAIEHGESMLVCGGTASGKTTTLNAILLFIPPQMKIVSIEDTRELNLPHENWVPSLTRSGFGAKNPITGKAPGEVDMFDLLTAALRQRPQYIMVGEVRGAEAYTVFQAMATGKTAYSTFHADDVQAMIHRMESDPINLPRALITALNLVLLQAQVKVGTKMTRRVKGLHEIVGLDPESNEIISNSAYTWNPADDTFNYSGHSYVYEKVAAAKNWSPRQMELEVKRRVDILTYMRESNMIHHKKVASLISAYYDHPDEVMEDVKNFFIKQGRGQPRG